MASGAQSKFIGRDEYRKQKELEEARKAGTAPAEVDEEGNAINPHIPQYIAQAPWYLQAQGPSLKHQRLGEAKEIQKEWYIRGIKRADKAEKFRAGACTNCGAMGHDVKSCLDRPRKKGSKFTNNVYQADDLVLPELQLDYDGKRDRWNGYDSTKHMEVVALHAKVEEERRKQKEEALKNISSTNETAAESKEKEKEKEKGEKEKAEKAEKAEKGKNDIKKLFDDSDSDSESEKDDDILGAREQGDEDAVGQKIDTKSRTTVRNLRIREDTAKYLRNLDLNSAFYDPKSRSMRENPFPTKDPNDAPFVGENFVRYTGDTPQVLDIQKFAWDAQEKGEEIHAQALPSQAEFAYRLFIEKKQNVKENLKDKILEQYGGEQYLGKADERLLMGQTEAWVEYSRDGKIINGTEERKVVSKWPEDVLSNNHTEIWGSYWVNGEWGYGCCHSTIKNSYCTGAAGKEARQSILHEQINLANLERKYLETPKQKTKEDVETERLKKEEKFRKALESEEKRMRQHSNEEDDRSRPYNSSRPVEEDEDEMEAYRFKRVRHDDPMANLLGKDELVS